MSQYCLCVLYASFCVHWFVLIFLQAFPNFIIIKCCSGENLYYFFDLNRNCVIRGRKNSHGVFVSVNTLFTSRFFTCIVIHLKPHLCYCLKYCTSNSYRLIIVKSKEKLNNVISVHVDRIDFFFVFLCMCRASCI